MGRIADRNEIKQGPRRLFSKDNVGYFEIYLRKMENYWNIEPNSFADNMNLTVRLVFQVSCLFYKMNVISTLKIYLQYCIQYSM